MAAERDSVDERINRNIIIIGGSYAGASVAHYLLRHAIPLLPDSAAVKVILVSASSEMFCRPACPRAMLADSAFDQSKLFVSIPQSFDQYSRDRFHFIHGTALKLDHIDCRIMVGLEDGTTKTLPFFSLVIATGASTISPLLGLNKDSQTLRAHWSELRKALPHVNKVVVAGGGPTGVECAGELGQFLNGQAGWFSSEIKNPKVPITLVTAGSQILPHLRPKIAAKAERHLARVGVTVKKGVRVTSAFPEGVGSKNALTGGANITLDSGYTLRADLYIPATGTKPNTSFVDASLLTSSGQVDTNTSTLRVDKAGPRVYAVGDVASYSRPAVHLILNAVPVVCANIKRDLLLSFAKDMAPEADREFKEDKRETQLVPIGTSGGVGAAMGFQLPSFLVWLIKGRDYWLWTTGALWSGKQWSKES